MITEIPKGTPEREIKNILKRRSNRRVTNNSIAAFFGKLPGIEDGLTFQKKVRREWK